MKINTTMTLAEAFRIRGQLKKTCSTLVEMFGDSVKSYRVDQNDRDAVPTNEKTLGRSAPQLIEAIVMAQETIAHFNVEVNKANFASGAQEIILNINGYKDIAVFLEGTSYSTKQFKEYDLVPNSVTGAVDRVEYRRTIDPKSIASIAKNVKDERFKLEADLAAANSKSFQISSALADRITKVLEEETW